MHAGSPLLRVAAGLALSALAALGPGCSEPERARPPSVILISIDALRRDHVGTYGYARDTTPRLDRLAETSLVFERAYAPASWTLISHMTMLTGLHPTQHGVVAGERALARELPTLAERLEAGGYHSVALSAGGWLGERFGFARGFDRWRLHDRGPELDLHLREELAARPPDRPLFLFVHVWDVHSADLTTPDATIYEPPDGFAELFLEDARERLRGIDAPALWNGDVRASPEQVEALVALYDASIRYADDLIGGWLDAWQAEGLLDEALVIVTSDHGESLWQRDGENDGHGGLREEGLQVPLLVRPPGGVPGGGRRSAVVSHVDLVPTVLDAVGAPIDAWLPGTSLLAAELPERPALAEWPPERAAIAWPYKRVWTEGAWEGWTFDLADDPGELRPIAPVNLPQRHDELRAHVDAALAEWRSSWAPVPECEPLEARASAEQLDELRKLGYVGDE